jgi:hypothetical protein
MTNNYEHKENRGSLFVNSKKLLPTHPDYKGTININGEVMWLSGWNSSSSKGINYISVSVSPMIETNNNNTTPQPEISVPNSILLDDEIPF